MAKVATSLSIFQAPDPLRLAYAGFLARYTGHTFKTYRSHLDLWLAWCAGVDVAPLEIKRPHVELWLRSLEDRGLASATRAAQFGVVSLFRRRRDHHQGSDSQRLPSQDPRG